LKLFIYDFGTPKGTSLCKTASFDVFWVKIGASVLAVRERKNPEKYLSQLGPNGFA